VGQSSVLMAEVTPCACMHVLRRREDLRCTVETSSGLGFVRFFLERQNGGYQALATGFKIRTALQIPSCFTTVI